MTTIPSRPNPPAPDAGGTTDLRGRQRIAILLVAVVLWLPGLRSDFWLDEIWTIDLVRRLSSLPEIFTRLHIDTNHWLNSICAFLLWPRTSWPLYRIPSFLAAIGTLLLLGALGRKMGRRGEIIALVLGASSFVLAVYASEARGYSLVMFFALLGWHSLQRALETRRTLWTAVFVLSALLGFLSHLTYLFIYLSFAAWTVVVLKRREGITRAAFIRLAALHLAPVLFFSVLYWIDIRFIQHGAGPVASPVWIFLRATALFSGGPAEGIVGVAAAAAVGGILLGEIIGLYRLRDDRAVFFAAALIIFPGLLYLIGLLRGFAYWNERHLVICMPFALLLLTRFLGRQLDAGKAGRIIFSAVLGFFLIGNLLHVADFLRYGRGQYLEALRTMDRETSTPVITVASDHDFRNHLLLSFYITYLPHERPLVYYQQNKPWPDDPEWFILHNDARSVTPLASIRSRSRGTSYRLVRHFPYGGISGWHWMLYRRMGPAASPGHQHENVPPAP